MKKEKIIFIISLITMIISSIISVYAANYLYNSNEVSYNNSSSGISSDNVQGAIDELYTEATNYNTLSTKVGSDTLTTTAQDLSGAVNELNSNLSNKAAKTWKYAGYAFSGGSVTISETYTEAIIFLMARNSNSTRRIAGSTMFFPDLWGEQINNKIEFLVAGYHLSDTDHGYGCIAVTNNGKTFTAQSFNYGSGAANSPYVMVYYR